MKKCMVVIALMAAFWLASPCWGQDNKAGTETAAKEDSNLDSYIQVLRSNLRTQKVAILTEAMHFSDAESAVFWPVYRNYELELSKLNDEKVALLKDYAGSYEHMSAATAKELTEKAFTLEQHRTDLKRKYFKEFVKVMPGNRVAKFFQVDNRLDLLMNVQIASQVPIIE